MRQKEFKEGLADLAQRAEMDHEVQMARADLYKIAKYSIKLHEMLKGISEAEGLEGWQQAKITKAADYISSVFHSLEYDVASKQMSMSPMTAESNYKKSLASKLTSKLSESSLCPDCGNPSYKTLPEEKQKGVDGKVCWKGYRRMGTKMKGGKRVDNCVKVG